MFSLLQQFGPQDPRRQTSGNEYAYNNYFGADKQPDSPPSRPGWSQGGGELFSSQQLVWRNYKFFPNLLMRWKFHQELWEMGFAFHFRLWQKVPGGIMFQQCPVHSGEGIEGSSRSPRAAGTEGPARISRGGGPAGTKGRHGRAGTARALGLKGRPRKDGHAWFSGHQWHSWHTRAAWASRPFWLGRVQRNGCK